MLPEVRLHTLHTLGLSAASGLVLRACLNRKETRSSHYRIDYPEGNDEAYTCSFVAKRDGDQLAFSTLRY